MPIFVGDQEVIAVKHGADDVIAVYHGADLVWSKAGIHETFDVDMLDLTAAGWTHYGSSVYKLGAAGGVARVSMPDGVSQLGEFVDWAQPDGIAPNNNAVLRVRVTTAGSDPSPSVSHYITDVFLRASNGAATHGAGIRFESSAVGIVRRVAGVDTLMKACGSFAAGDTFELKPAGNLYSLYRNGNYVDEWDDVSASASTGAGFRSVLLRGTGGRELFGARRFSPAVDVIDYA